MPLIYCADRLTMTPNCFDEYVMDDFGNATLLDSAQEWAMFYYGYGE